MFCEEAWTRIMVATDYKLKNGGSQKLILDRYMEYLNWYYPALAEAYERGEDWSGASSAMAQHEWLQYEEWARGQWPENTIWLDSWAFMTPGDWADAQRRMGQTPLPQFYRSDYDRQTNYRYYNLSLYYLRKRAKANGLPNSIRELQTVLDITKQAWLPTLQSIEDRLTRVRNGEPPRPAR